MDEESLKYWIALRAVEEVGCVGFRALLKAFSSPKSVFSAPARTLKIIPGIGAKTADNILSFSAWKAAEEEVVRAGKLGVAIVTCEDPLYPKNLLYTYDYPPFLYVKGTLDPEDVPVAVVGSRLASAYGRYTTERISRELALKGIVVVSGLARGIDAAAHRGALAGKGRTIAVLGSGLDTIYPPENEKLAEAIAASGALITEFPFGTPPNSPNFPARNRIISGISLGVVVVEAGEKSGSLITARLAAEQGRSVFAVPGAIESAGSRGTHRLIRQGAKLIENVEDILEEILPQAGILPAFSGKPAGVSAPPDDRRPALNMAATQYAAPEASDAEQPDREAPDTAQPAPGMPDDLQHSLETLDETPPAPGKAGAAAVSLSGLPKPAKPPASSVPGLPEPERKLLNLITETPTGIDALIAASGLAPREVQSGLLVLELRGLIRQLPGKQFVTKE